MQRNNNNNNNNVFSKFNVGTCNACMQCLFYKYFFRFFFSCIIYNSIISEFADDGACRTVFKHFRIICSRPDNQLFNVMFSKPMCLHNSRNEYTSRGKKGVTFAKTYVILQHTRCWSLRRDDMIFDGVIDAMFRNVSKDVYYNTTCE